MNEPGAEQSKPINPDASAIHSETGGERDSGKPAQTSESKPRPVLDFDDSDQPWDRTDEALKSGKLKRGTFQPQTPVNSHRGLSGKKPR